MATCAKPFWPHTAPNARGSRHRLKCPGARALSKQKNAIGQPADPRVGGAPRALGVGFHGATHIVDWGPEVGTPEVRGACEQPKSAKIHCTIAYLTLCTRVGCHEFCLNLN